MDFDNRCEYKNIGIAFCIGLTNETTILILGGELNERFIYNWRNIEII
jgi:uncharacterized metal-binding protein